MVFGSTRAWIWVLNFVERGSAMGWTYRRKETEYGKLMDVEYYPIDTMR